MVVANNTSFHNQDGMVAGASGATSTVFDNSVISNNIFYDNVRYGVYESDALGSHNQYLNNVIYGNPGGISMITGQMLNTVSADPRFVNYTGDAGGDYHLTATSPAIHRGATAGAASTDFDGSPRGSVPDIGAYQFKAPQAVSQIQGSR